MKTLLIVTFILTSSYCCSQFYVKVNFLGGTLRSLPQDGNNIILSINTGDSVLIIGDYKKPFFKVKFDSTEGWISYASFEKNKAVEEIIYNDLVKENPKMARLSKAYGLPIASRICSGEYWIGMLDIMALESLGKPDNVNESVGAWGNHQQWIYKQQKLNLYFENGKLTSFQR